VPRRFAASKQTNSKKCFAKQRIAIASYEQPILVRARGLNDRITPFSTKGVQLFGVLRERI